MPAADPSFLLNDGPRSTARLLTSGFRYRRLTDAITGVELRFDSPIDLAAHGARWLKAEK